MDPNAALEHMRSGLKDWHKADLAKTEESGDEQLVAALEAVAEGAEALDNWMTSGGFPPNGWRQTVAVPSA